MPHDYRQEGRVGGGVTNKSSGISKTLNDSHGLNWGKRGEET